MAEYYRRQGAAPGELEEIPKEIGPAFNKLFGQVLSENPEIEAGVMNPYLSLPGMRDMFVERLVPRRVTLDKGETFVLTEPESLEDIKEDLTYQMFLQMRGEDAAEAYTQKMLAQQEQANEMGPHISGPERERRKTPELKLPTSLPEGYGSGGRISLI